MSGDLVGFYSVCFEIGDVLVVMDIKFKYIIEYREFILCKVMELVDGFSNS